MNRSRYSFPQDVLEPDCCDGNHRTEQVVLEVGVEDLLTAITADFPEYQFSLKHAPLTYCYPHSLIWCNSEGDAERPYATPSKTIRNLIRAEILARMKLAGRVPREFVPLSR